MRETVSTTLLLLSMIAGSLYIFLNFDDFYGIVQDPIGKVSLVDGEVLVKQPDELLDGRLNENKNIANNAILKTGVNSVAVVTLINGQRLLVKENSIVEVNLSEGRDYKISIMAGEIKADVKKRETIITKSPNYKRKSQLRVTKKIAKDEKNKANVALKSDREIFKLASKKSGENLKEGKSKKTSGHLGLTKAGESTQEPKGEGKPTNEPAEKMQGKLTDFAGAKKDGKPMYDQSGVALERGVDDLSRGKSSRSVAGVEDLEEKLTTPTRSKTFLLDQVVKRSFDKVRKAEIRVIKTIITKKRKPDLTPPVKIEKIAPEPAMPLDRPKKKVEDAKQEKLKEQQKVKKSGGALPSISLYNNNRVWIKGANSKVLILVKGENVANMKLFAFADKKKVKRLYFNRVKKNLFAFNYDFAKFMPGAKNRSWGKNISTAKLDVWYTLSDNKKDFFQLQTVSFEYSLVEDLPEGGYLIKFVPSKKLMDKDYKYMTKGNGKRAEVYIRSPQYLYKLWPVINRIYSIDKEDFPSEKRDYGNFLQNGRIVMLTKSKVTAKIFSGLVDSSSFAYFGRQDASVGYLGDYSAALSFFENEDLFKSTDSVYFLINGKIVPIAVELIRKDSSAYNLLKDKYEKIFFKKIEMIK